MWPFILTRSVTLQRKIQASKEEVLGIVQDPDEALRLSPLVFSVIRDDKDPAWYTVTERLPILGGFYGAPDLNTATFGQRQIWWPKKIEKFMSFFGAETCFLGFYFHQRRVLHSF
jgi:hypothetical protein